MVTNRRAVLERLAAMKRMNAGPFFLFEFNPAEPVGTVEVVIAERRPGRKGGLVGRRTHRDR
jgi:hypothetical protein